MDDEYKPLLKKIKKELKDRIEAVHVSKRLVSSPACVVAGENELNPSLRRMLEAGGQAVPDSKPILEVNVGHPLVERLSGEADDKRFGALAQIVLDHALLAEGSQLDDPAAYVQRMNSLLLELDSNAGTG
jgi:molecular chaperone HtpG